MERVYIGEASEFPFLHFYYGKVKRIGSIYLDQIPLLEPKISLFLCDRNNLIYENVQSK